MQTEHRAHFPLCALHIERHPSIEIPYFFLMSHLNRASRPGLDLAYFARAALRGGALALSECLAAWAAVLVRFGRSESAYDTHILQRLCRPSGLLASALNALMSFSDLQALQTFLRGGFVWSTKNGANCNCLAGLVLRIATTHLFCGLVRGKEMTQTFSCPDIFSLSFEPCKLIEVAGQYRECRCAALPDQCEH